MEHLSLKESAYKIIKGKLLEGEFEPGSRIREDLLASEISMSRTPVREAVNQLSVEGFLNNIPRKGIYTLNLSKAEIYDLLDVRISLETLAAARCIEKIAPEQLKHLQDNLDEFEFALSKEKFDKCNQLDSSFHKEIAAISGNMKLIEFLSEIEDFMRIARFIEKKSSPAEKNLATFKEHSKILECIKNKDKNGAIAAITNNIETMKKNMNI